MRILESKCYEFAKIGLHFCIHLWMVNDELQIIKI